MVASALHSRAPCHSTSPFRFPNQGAQSPAHRVDSPPLIAQTHPLHLRPRGGQVEACVQGAGSSQPSSPHPQPWVRKSSPMPLPKAEAQNRTCPPRTVVSSMEWSQALTSVSSEMPPCPRPIGLFGRVGEDQEEGADKGQTQASHGCWSHMVHQEEGTFAVHQPFPAHARGVTATLVRSGRPPARPYTQDLKHYCAAGASPVPCGGPTE